MEQSERNSKRGDVMLGGKEFFLKTFEEGYDENAEQVEKDTPETIVETEVKPTEVVEEPVVEVPENVDEVKVDKFNIDGEVITIDQIKEWKQNGLRQSDYTKKTQELAEQRKKLEELKVEIPEQDDFSELSRLEKIERDLATKELDLEITTLKAKYPDFNEVEVLNEANQRGVYDLEFIYKATRSEVPVTQIDVEALKAQAIEEYKANIEATKQKNKEATSGSIVSSTPGHTAVDYGEELSHSEKEYCAKRGWTHKEYVDMKNNVYKI